MRLEDFLVAARHGGDGGLTYPEIVERVERLELPDGLVESHIRFDEGTYARNLVLRTQTFELLVLCWRPGQRSTIHDHGGSVGVVRVYRGDLTSRLFSVAEGAPATPISEDLAWPGAHAAVDRADVHQLANQSDRDVVTVHVYSPPLGAVGVYSTDAPGRDEVRLRYSLQDDLT
jgi:predicted metal-dependent enzyme (double-stranded beta helix superfamily)